MATLSNQHQDLMACKAKNISSPALYRKSWLLPGLDQGSQRDVSHHSPRRVSSEEKSLWSHQFETSLLGSTLEAPRSPTREKPAGFCLNVLTFISPRDPLTTLTTIAPRWEALEFFTSPGPSNQQSSIQIPTENSRNGPQALEKFYKRLLSEAWSAVPLGRSAKFHFCTAPNWTSGRLQRPSYQPATGDVREGS